MGSISNHTLAMPYHQTAKTHFVEDANGTRHAYRRFGEASTVPVLFLMHFRGTMDYWDPLLVNTIASKREVTLIDNAGVGQSTGQVANTVQGMAQHIIDFLKLIEVHQVDILGFSMGGFVAPLVYLNGPKHLVRRLVIAGSSPSIGEGIIQHPPGRQQAIGEYAGKPIVAYEDTFDHLSFAPSETSQQAGRDWYKRIFERNESISGEERSQVASYNYLDGGAGIQAMQHAGNAFMSIEQRQSGSYDRLSEITIPVFVAQGHDDFMIPTQNSWVMQQKLRDARLKIFPDSGHGFLYQFAEEFGDDVCNFLAM